MIEHILNIVLAVTKQTNVTAARATYYAPKFEGRKMADSEIYRNSYTCAYNKLPLGAWVRITNPKNGLYVVVQNTDRKAGPGIDLSKTVFVLLGLSVQKGSGTVLVKALKDYEAGKE